MLCDKCKTNKATVHIRQSINGTVTEYDLCDKCAAESEMINDGFGFDGLFGGFLNGMGNTESVRRKEGSGICPVCGLSFEEFINGGRLGCPDCYTAFGDRLKGVLKNIQGSTLHTGKGSDEARRIKTEEAPKELTEEEKLKNELEQAIKAENYEKAAEIRDEIRALKGKED